MTRFQNLVQQLSQFYQSLVDHLLPHHQDTPRTVQDQEIAAGAVQKSKQVSHAKSPGEVFIYNNSYFQSELCPFSDIHNLYYLNLQLVGLQVWSGV